jgi:hypothetical protein
MDKWPNKIRGRPQGIYPKILNQKAGLGCPKPALLLFNKYQII